jgi:hypothetical protein
MKTLITRVIFLFLITSACLFAETKLDISGIIEWDTMQIKADVSFDLASAGIRLPSGRIQGESILNAGYINLILSGILDLQVDSSSTIKDLIDRGELSLFEAQALASNASGVSPALSPDMKSMYSSYTITLSGVSAALLKHSRPAEIARTLTPVSAAQYTGIVIIASQSLPVYGMKSTTQPIPCLFPKIWDSEMNLIYERNMLESRDNSMVRYLPANSIFRNNPSGLSPELQEFVGERPLRIFARGVFGINPTDLIIDHDDAMLIISSDENRRLLSKGKVALILDDSVLRRNF